MVEKFSLVFTKWLLLFAAHIILLLLLLLLMAELFAFLMTHGILGRNHIDLWFLLLPRVKLLGVRELLNVLLAVVCLLMFSLQLAWLVREIHVILGLPEVRKFTPFAFKGDKFDLGRMIIVPFLVCQLRKLSGLYLFLRAGSPVGLRRFLFFSMLGGQRCRVLFG